MPNHPCTPWQPEANPTSRAPPLQPWEKMSGWMTRLHSYERPPFPSGSEVGTTLLGAGDTSTQDTSALHPPKTKFEGQKHPPSSQSQPSHQCPRGDRAALMQINTKGFTSLPGSVVSFSTRFSMHSFVRNKCNVSRVSPSGKVRWCTVQTWTFPCMFFCGEDWGGFDGPLRPLWGESVSTGPFHS